MSHHIMVLTVLALSEVTCFFRVHNIVCYNIHIFNFQCIFIYQNCSKIQYFYTHMPLLTEIFRVVNKQDRSHNKNCCAYVCVCVCVCVGVCMCTCVDVCVYVHVC